MKQLLFAVYFSLLAIIGPTLVLGVSPDEVETLRGIKGIEVVVGVLPPAFKKIGLTRETIKQDVALKLRMAGIQILKKNEIFSEPGGPYLFIGVTVRNSSNLFIYHIVVELRQQARLVRAPDITGCCMGTWETGVLGGGEIRTISAQKIRNAIKDQVDKFINDYLSVNPKK
jgi:hypothetical protein